jgi:hypothetical protein
MVLGIRLVLGANFFNQFFCPFRHLYMRNTTAKAGKRGKRRAIAEIITNRKSMVPIKRYAKSDLQSSQFFVGAISLWLSSVHVAKLAQSIYVGFRMANPDKPERIPKL